MGEAIKTMVKAPETKKENQVSQVQKGNFYQPYSSPVDQILFLQRTNPFALSSSPDLVRISAD